MNFMSFLKFLNFGISWIFSMFSLISPLFHVLSVIKTKKQRHWNTKKSSKTYKKKIKLSKKKMWALPDTFSVTGWRLVCRFRCSWRDQVLSWHDATGCTVQRDLVAVAQSVPPKCVPSPPALCSSKEKEGRLVISTRRLHNTKQCKQEKGWKRK